MRLSTFHSIVAAMLQCAATIIAPSARAQSDSAHSAKAVPWVTRRDVIAFGAALGGTLAVAPLDRSISGDPGDPERIRSSSVRRTVDNIAFFGGSGPFVLSGLVYAAGTEGHMQTLAHAALHNMEAIALASSITGLAKGLTGRALPDVVARHEFSFGRGFHDDNGPFVSFPSGHTASAFAMAATITGEVSRASPGAGEYVGPLVYTGAAAVGVARVMQHVHWASDLPLAVVIGMWSGRTVQKRAYKKGRAAVALSGMTIAPARGGRTLIGWSSLGSNTN